MTVERRGTQRIDSHNLLTYICLDEDNHELKQGMGRTLNVGEGGILLETHTPMEPKEIVVLTVGLEEELMEIRGRITFCNSREDGNFESGIQFIEIDDEKLQFLKQFIVLFKGHKEEM